MAKQKGESTDSEGPKSGLEMRADEVLVPGTVAHIKYGEEVIEIKPMSFGAAIKIARFITKNFGRAFNSDSFKKAKLDPETTSVEMWVGVASEFLSVLDENEVVEILCDITQKDKEFVKKNFSLLGMTRVIKAVYFTEDFREIFLELGKMAANQQEESK